VSAGVAFAHALRVRIKPAVHRTVTSLVACFVAESDVFSDQQQSQFLQQNQHGIAASSQRPVSQCLGFSGSRRLR